MQEPERAESAAFVRREGASPLWRIVYVLPLGRTAASDAVCGLWGQRWSSGSRTEEGRVTRRITPPPPTNVPCVMTQGPEDNDHNTTPGPRAAAATVAHHHVITSHNRLQIGPIVLISSQWPRHELMRTIKKNHVDKMGYTKIRLSSKIRFSKALL